MQALVMHGYGSVEATKLAELPVPPFGADDILVRTSAAGINPVECKEIGGILKEIYPQNGDWIVGGEGAGIIEAVGSQVTNFAPGDAVLFITDRGAGGGSLAEYTRVPAALAAFAPETISLSAAACIPTAGLTAYQGLFRADQGNLQRGQFVFVHGASGGVGSFAVGLGHAQSLKVLASCRPENAAYVTSLGASDIVDYRRDIEQQWQALNVGAVDVVLDCYSGGQRPELLPLIRRGGRLTVVLTGHESDMQALIARGAERGITVTFMIIDMARSRSDLAAIAALIDSGQLQMPELRVFPLQAARDALLTMGHGGVRGKIVVVIPELSRA